MGWFLFLVIVYEAKTAWIIHLIWFACCYSEYLFFLCFCVLIYSIACLYIFYKPSRNDDTFTITWWKRKVIAFCVLSFRHTWKDHYYLYRYIYSSTVIISVCVCVATLALEFTWTSYDVWLSFTFISVIVIKYWSTENLSTNKILASLKRNVHSLWLQLNVRLNKSYFVVS